MVLRVKHFNIIGLYRKILFLGTVLEKAIYKGGVILPKKGALTACRFKSLVTKSRWGFSGGGLTSQCALCIISCFQYVVEEDLDVP